MKKLTKEDKLTDEQKKSQEERFKIAQKFAKELIKKFKKNVKSVIVYGSVAKGKHTKKSDIDIFVIIDDTKIERDIPTEVKDRIWNELISIAKETDKRITIQAFMFLTEFWESVRGVEPVLMDVLRSGLPVYDVGVFMPAKRMLNRGKIPTTRESVEKKMYAAPQFVEYAQARIKSVAHYLEQAMAAAGQAPLMYIGKVPPAKEDVPRQLNDYFVKEKLLEEKYVKDAEKLHDFAKEVEYMNKKDLNNLGIRVDEYIKMANRFVKRMNKLVRELEQRKKSSVLMRTYKTFLKANVGALKLKGIQPPEKLKDLPTTMYEHFPELKDQHSGLFDRLNKSLALLKKGQVEKIPERDIYEIREQTKMFVITLGKKLKDLKDKGEIVIPEKKEEKKKQEKSVSIEDVKKKLEEDKE